MCAVVKVMSTQTAAMREESSRPPRLARRVAADRPARRRGRGQPRLPRPGAARRLRRRGRAGRRAADLRRRPRPRGRGDQGVLRPLRRRRADRHRRAAPRRCARPSPPSTRTSGPGSRSRSAGCGSPARPSSSADVVTDLGPGARVTQRLVPVDRVGLYVPGGVAPAGLERADERRARPGRRRRLDRADQLAAEGPFGVGRWPPHPDDPGGLRAARHRGGVRRRRRPGDRDVRLRRRPLPSRRPGHRPGQHLHRLGQAAAQGRRRHRLRGRARPRSRSWPTTPPTRRTSPPT